MSRSLPNSTNSEKIPKILFVDDEQAVLKALLRFARSKSWHAETALSGEQALDLLGKEEFDIIVSDMNMPGMDGADLLQEVREKFPQAIRILLTGYSDVGKMEAAINRGGIFNYLSKPWDELLLAEMLENAFQFRENDRERVRLQTLTREQNRKLGKIAISLDQKVKERTIEIDQALTLLTDLQDRTNKKYFDTLSILHKVSGCRDQDHAEASRFVQDQCLRLANIVGLGSSELDNLTLASQLYRIGEISLPDGIIGKPLYQLDPNQRKLLANTSLQSEQLLSTASGLREVARIIRHKNENINGTGNPDGLVDNEIPSASKIIRLVADYYNLLHGLIEENIFGSNAAMRYIKDNAGKYYDLQFVDMFEADLNSQPTIKISHITLGTDKLTSGMLLNRDVISKNGSILFTKGTILNKRNIESLRQFEARLNEVFTIQVKPPTTIH